jgi:hypothetical protein
MFVIGVLLATYLDEDSLARQDGWRFAAIAVAAYVLSRGLAKLGTREPYTDEGDRLSQPLSNQRQQRPPQLAAWGPLLCARRNRHVVVDE